MEVSNPDKIIFPDAGFTKADLVGHYERVGARMLGYVAGRPLTLQRFPNGIGAKGFMQKNAGKHFPETIRRWSVPKRDGGTTNYPIVERAEDLAYLANQGTVTFHMWTTTADRPSHPDWMVIDLDPVAGDVDAVRDATRIVAETLAEFGIDGFPVATGSKGFHVWVPLDGDADHNDVSRTSRAIAGLATNRHPDRLTTEFLKKNRAGRVFVDWLRNGPTATVVAPYSLRPRRHAPMATPLRWNELADTNPDRWTLDDVGDRLDLEPGVDPQHLPVEQIVAAALAAGVDLDTPHDRFGRN